MEAHFHHKEIFFISDFFIFKIFYLCDRNGLPHKAQSKYIPIKRTIARTTCDGRNLLEHWKWWTGPDLNPIEQIWGELENKLDRSIVHLKESLWLELRKAWDNISVEVLIFFLNIYMHVFVFIYT